MERLRIRPARADERQLLEDLQSRASLALDEYREVLTAHPDAIALPAGQIESGAVLVAETGERRIGFAVVLENDGVAELDGLFVEPEFWRRGIGFPLVEAAVHMARRRGLSLMTVVAAPSAQVFYARCGFTVEGAAETRFGPALRMSR